MKEIRETKFGLVLQFQLVGCVGTENALLPTAWCLNTCSPSPAVTASLEPISAAVTAPQYPRPHGIEI